MRRMKKSDIVWIYLFLCACIWKRFRKLRNNPLNYKLIKCMRIKRKRDNNAADNGRFSVLIYARVLYVLCSFYDQYSVRVQKQMCENIVHVFMICPNAPVCECQSHNMQTHTAKCFGISVVRFAYGKLASSGIVDVVQLSSKIKKNSSIADDSESQSALTFYLFIYTYLIPRIYYFLMLSFKYFIPVDTPIYTIHTSKSSKLINH